MINENLVTIRIHPCKSLYQSLRIQAKISFRSLQAEIICRLQDSLIHHEKFMNPDPVMQFLLRPRGKPKTGARKQQWLGKPGQDTTTPDCTRDN